MGRRNGPSIIYQVVEAFNGMKAYGESRHEAKQKRREDGEDSVCRTPGIFSVNTIKNYTKHACAFVRWTKEMYGCKTLAEARTYGAEYLQMRANRYYDVDNRLSAWTIHLDCAAISKLFDCGMKDWGVDLPGRKREEVIRSRKPAKRDKHVSATKNKNVLLFLDGTGLRRCEVQKIRPENVSEDGKFLYNIKGKGGRIRNVEVLHGYESIIRSITDEALSKGRKKIFGKISANIDVHAHRRWHAQEFYKQCIETGRTYYDGSKNPIYYCRKDLAGTTFIRGAMLEVSQQLGHNREDIIALSYLT